MLIGKTQTAKIETGDYKSIETRTRKTGEEESGHARQHHIPDSLQPH